MTCRGAKGYFAAVMDTGVVNVALHTVGLVLLVRCAGLLRFLVLRLRGESGIVLLILCKLHSVRM